MTTNFYSDLQGFYDFSEACNVEHYQPAPDDWYVVAADVAGSTKAIEHGRYKDVNMVGAACIVSVINCCRGVEIPFVFGGDGATILVPPQFVETVTNELISLKHAALTLHQLQLRVCCVQISVIRELGKDVHVAKHLTEKGCALAMFRGGGALLADRLLKQDGYEIKTERAAGSPNLSGLSCRWQPIPSKNDTMLTLLVMSTGRHESSHTYRKINTVLSDILSLDANPVHPEIMTYSWPTFETLRQSQMVWRQGKKMKNMAGHIFMISFFNFLNRFDISVGSFDPMRYRNALVTNSDYRKFDDMLRMVVDCTKLQAAKIEKRLAKWRKQKKIVYGTHYSDTALMTCFVVTTKDDGHVHFIDGNYGGYALAAKRLKQQLAEQVSKNESVVRRRVAANV